MIMPLVSIITPCYNCENYIERYLKNILDQTYHNIELIMINDGSVDDTEKIIMSYIPYFKKYGSTIIYQYQQNKGIGGAVNTALKLITGELFTWCDADNYYSPDYVEKKVKYFIEHENCNILRCDGYIVLDSDINKTLAKFSDHNRDKFAPNLFLNAIKEKNFHFGCAMLRTKSFDEINPKREIFESKHGQNWQLLLPMFYKYISYYIDEPLFYFVYRKDSVSNIASSHGLIAQVEQQIKYEEILVTVIKQMNIPEELEILNIIHEKYRHRILNIGYEYHEKNMVNEQYQILCSMNKITLKDRFKYMATNNRKIGFIFQKANKIKHIIIKMLRVFYLLETRMGRL